MQTQQLFSKKNILFALFAVVVFVVYGAFEFGFIETDFATRNKKPTIDKTRDLPGTVAILDGNIIINEPVSNDAITSPLKTSGRARVFEASLSYRLKDANNELITEGYTTASEGAPSWGFYSVEIEYDPPSTETGWIEVYSISAKDGSDQDLIRMPLTFADYKIPTVEVYFSNINKDPELLNCDVVYSVTREVSSSKELIIGSLNHLLSGVTDVEIREGFISNLPEGEKIKVQGLELVEGVMTVDFNEELDKDVTGLCRVQAIKAQIEETLKQFEGVTEVVITVAKRASRVLR